MKFDDYKSGTLFKMSLTHKLFHYISDVWHDHNDAPEFASYELVRILNDKVYLIVDLEYYPNVTREYDFGIEIPCFKILDGEKIKWINGNDWKYFTKVS
jgi:hypothetical protein